MDVFNKLYSSMSSSVSSTVSQLSGVLPGNPVTREFEASEHVASAGPGLLWKIYRGFKKSTKQEASIFVFEKRQLEKWSKEDRDSMLEQLKRGITQLTKIRHPCVLIVQHPLEESRESLAFATEPVFGSLANVLGQHNNMPQPLPSEFRDYKLFDVEIKYGLVQLLEGLAFLHSDVKLLHRNICPESIIINKAGAWKISGFDFCSLNQTPHEAKPYWSLPDYNSSWHALTQPPLEYTAPEVTLISSHSPASDIYALGVLIYAMHNTGGKPLKQFGKDYGAFKRFAGELKQGRYPNLSILPEGIQDHVKLMLNATPEMRPDVHELPKVAYFDDVAVKALSYLDALFQWDNLQKSKFYKGLPQVMQKMPHRVNIHRILPCLVKEFVNPPMVPFVLPNVILIAESATEREYTQLILPSLKSVMKLQEPVQILLIFMQKMELLLKLTPAEDVKTDVLPMLYRALESDAQQIQELCLSVLPTFASMIDYPAMKNALLPRIKKLCMTTQFLSVRVNCLLCIGKLLDHLDKWLVLDEVLPFLGQIPSREPAVLMGILGIYKLALTHNKLGITKEVMATKVIPYLMPLCIENGLSLTQFNAMITLVKEMVNRIEVEHRTKLEQLNSIQQESKQLDMNYNAATGPLVPSAPLPITSDMDKMFTDLGLETFVAKTAEPSNGGSSTNTSSLSAIPTSMSSNSLSEKQRLAKHQEQSQRLQNTTELVAKPAMMGNSSNNNNNRGTPKPIDLTSKLIDSNLNQIKSPTGNNNSNTLSNWPGTGGMSNSNSGDSNWGAMTSAPSSASNNGANWNANFSGMSSMGSSNSSQTLQSPTQWTAVPAMSNNSNSNGNSNNWSALDNLLPNKPQKTPMNQMMLGQGQQPLLMAHSQATGGGGGTVSGNKGTNQLSQQDIMEFLG